MANLHFTFEMGDPTHLDHIINSITTVDGVFAVYRTGTPRPD